MKKRPTSDSITTEQELDARLAELRAAKRRRERRQRMVDYASDILVLMLVVVLGVTSLYWSELTDNQPRDSVDVLEAWRGFITGFVVLSAASYALRNIKAYHSRKGQVGK